MKKSKNVGRAGYDFEWCNYCEGAKVPKGHRLTCEKRQQALQWTAAKSATTRALQEEAAKVAKSEARGRQVKVMELKRVFKERL